MGSDSDLVWSSDGGDLRANRKMQREKPRRGKACPGEPPVPAGPWSTIKVKRETSGRRGKTATTISEIPLGEKETKALDKRLKQHCGVGGTARGSNIELQGDHREKVLGPGFQPVLRAVLAGG